MFFQNIQIFVYYFCLQKNSLSHILHYVLLQSYRMRITYQKVKTEHHILTEFKKFLFIIEKDPIIHRIIPGRINRQQKWSSDIGFKISYPTSSGLKCIMCKWSTAQEVFFVCAAEETELLSQKLRDAFTAYLSDYL